MKNSFILCLCAAIFSTGSLLQAVPTDSLLQPKKEEPKIFVNNRILAKINGKPITTYDLMKKMSLSFYREYPEYLTSTPARFQYYQMGWKYTLEEMIDKELILADAEESKIDVTSGDVRQEMETSFGPNIIVNLDKLGMGFDEAAKMIKEEIIIQKMIAGRVHAKALRTVTPIKIRKAYDDFTLDPKNARQTEWTYRVVTIKDRDIKKTEELANKTYEILMQGVSLDQLPDRLKEQKLLNRKAKVTVSADLKNNEQELSDIYKDMLSSLDTGMYSQPFAHKSRSNNTTVYRILVVVEKVPGGMPSYKDMEAKMKNHLLSRFVDEETDLYLQKLRQHYHIRQSDLESFLPADYQPFELK